MPGRIPSETEVLGYLQQCNNWEKFGRQDQLGTMNYITPAKRKQAASLVKEGITVSCARVIAKDVRPAPDDQFPVRHMMNASGEQWAGKKSNTPGELQHAGDQIFMGLHGFTVTHVDGLCHIFWDGRMYNGVPSEKITLHQGATFGSIELLHDGVISRAVFFDMPNLKGVKWLDYTQGVHPEDLDEAEKTCGVKVGSGDILMVRTGMLRRRNEEGPWDLQSKGISGYHAACLPWLHQREVAMVVSDTANDVKPSGYKTIRNPVHQIGMTAMGLWLLDSADLEELAATCDRLKRWEFMLTVNPLRFSHGTGSPVNPVALF